MSLLLATQTPDDSGDHWWSGVALNLVAVGAAALVATNALAAQLPLHTRSQPNEIVPYTASGDAGAIGTFISLGSGQPSVRIAYGLEDEIVPVVVEEEYWQNPVPPLPASNLYPKPWLGEQVGEVPRSATGGDTGGSVGTFIGGSAAPPRIRYVDGLEDELPAPFASDEDYWANPSPRAAPAAAVPQPWQWEQGELPAPQFAGDDEGWIPKPQVLRPVWIGPFMERDEFALAVLTVSPAPAVRLWVVNDPAVSTLGGGGGRPVAIASSGD